jgi:hypothetical protein
MSGSHRNQMLTRPMTMWKKRFAWLPVRIGTVRIWLKSYEMKQIRIPEGFAYYVRLEYGSAEHLAYAIAIN